MGKVDYVKRFAKSDGKKYLRYVVLWGLLTAITTWNIFAGKTLYSRLSMAIILLDIIFILLLLVCLSSYIKYLLPSVSPIYGDIKKQMGEPLKEAVENINASFANEEILYEGISAVLNRRYLLFQDNFLLTENIKSVAFTGVGTPQGDAYFTVLFVQIITVEDVKKAIVLKPTSDAPKFLETVRENFNHIEVKNKDII